MSSPDETISVFIPSETMDFENDPCWCVECGWDGVEDDLTFTNDGIFVCPECGGEDTDYYYTEEAENCVFCGSDDVVGVIDIVSLNEIHEATPLDKEQVYGYCARCADVKMAESRFDKLSKEIADEYEEKGMSPEKAEKIGDATAAKIGRAKYGKKKFDKMAEGSTGDQIVSWEDGAGVSSPSMPPADIFWSETKKERIASGKDMHYAIPSEKKYPIWDKAHARMALAWSRGTKYADKVEKAVSKRFPSMAAESWAAEFAALGEPDAPYDQGYDDQQDESLGERHPGPHEQSLKDRRDEADAMDKKTGRKYHDVGTMDLQPWNPEIVMDSEHHKGQGYDDELDESLGMSHKESGMKQSFKDRRDESKGTEKFDHSRAYSRVKAMDAENMGLTQYVGSAGGSGDGTPVSYGGIALPESDVAAMVESSTENPMGASIGTVMGTMGAEDVPVVPDPSSFPQGDGRVLGQQTDQANLSPLHAEGFGCGCPGGICTTESDDWWDCDPEGRGGRCGDCPECLHIRGAEGDVQMVKIQDPVLTGAKMALGVVALNATAIGGAAILALALSHAARKEE